MAINLTKGENINLTKQVAGLSRVRVGAGWDVAANPGEEFDLDLMCISLNSDDKLVHGDGSFLFFNSPKNADGTLAAADNSIVHSGDSRDGEGDGDDEVITIDLSAVNSTTEKIVFVVAIFEAESRGQTFGRVRNAYIRIVDENNREEIVRYDLGEDFYSDTALVFGQLYRYSGEWKFRAMGESNSGGLIGILRAHGLDA